MAATVVLPEGRQVFVPAGAFTLMARELAAYLKETGGGRTAGGERRQRDKEEEQHRNKGSGRSTTTERLHFPEFVLLRPSRREEEFPRLGRERVERTKRRRVKEIRNGVNRCLGVSAHLPRGIRISDNSMRARRSPPSCMF